jgi:hypothetical protein
MSQQNVELVRHVFDDWKLGEVDEMEIRSVFHPDVEFVPLRAGMEKFVADTEEVFEKFDFDCQLLDMGERVLAWGNFHVRARGSGIETDIPRGRIRVPGREDRALGGFWLEGEGPRIRAPAQVVMASANP